MPTPSAITPRANARSSRDVSVQPQSRATQRALPNQISLRNLNQAVANAYVNRSVPLTPELQALNPVALRPCRRITRRQGVKVKKPLHCPNETKAPSCGSTPPFDNRLSERHPTSGLGQAVAHFDCVPNRPPAGSARRWLNRSTVDGARWPQPPLACDHAFPKAVRTDAGTKRGIAACSLGALDSEIGSSE